MSTSDTSKSVANKAKKKTAPSNKVAVESPANNEAKAATKGSTKREIPPAAKVSEEKIEQPETAADGHENKDAKTSESTKAVNRELPPKEKAGKVKEAPLKSSSKASPPLPAKIISEEKVEPDAAATDGHEKKDTKASESTKAVNRESPPKEKVGKAPSKSSSKASPPPPAQVMPSEKIEPEVATDGRENKDVKTLEDAKAETVSRVSYLKTLNDADLQATTAPKTRDVAWKILSSSDDWKQWQYEIGNVLHDEKYIEIAAALLGRCLVAITDEAEEGTYKLARNLLSTLNAFSPASSAFKKAVIDSNVMKDVTDFLSRQESFVDQMRQALLVKNCLRLPLILGYYSPPVWKTVEEKVIDSKDKSVVKLLPTYMTAMNDEECRCLATLWFFRLSEYRKTINNSIITSENVSLLAKFLKISLENADNAFVTWLVNGIAAFSKSSPENLEKIRQTDIKKSLLQLVDNGTGYIGYVLKKAKLLLTELAPEAEEKWKMMTFKANNELKTVEAVRSENALRIAFLNKLYDLSPESIVCLDANNAINLLQTSRLLYKQSSEEWKTAYESVLLQEKFIETALKYVKILTKCPLDKNDLAAEMAEDFYRMLWNLSDCSEPIRIRIAETGLVDFLLDNLKDVENVTKKFTSNEHFDYVLVSSTISILYNTSRTPQVKHVFLARDAANLLVPYICPIYRKTVQVSLCIAYVVSDTPEAARLADEQGVIKILTAMTNEAMSRPNRTAKTASGSTWSLSELLDGLCLLATNDGNKMKLLEHDVATLLNKLLVNGEHSEKIRGVDLLWTLCFDEAVREEIMLKHHDNIVKPLKELTQSENKEVQNTAKKTSMFIEKQWGAAKEEDAKRAKRRQSPTTDSAPPKMKKSVAKPAEQPQISGPAGHVFISYSWKQQETVLRIRKELLSHNFKVWMDVDKMHGGLLDAMAEAVENAAVVVLCFSQSYKESNPCRAEAQYAYSLGKKIVPVNMEYRYQADGWLGIMVRPLLYVDMSLSQKSFDTAMEELFREITNALGITIDSLAIMKTPESNSNNNGTKPPKDPPAAEEPPPRTHGSVVVAPPAQKAATTTTTTTKAKLADWSSADVAKWLKNENLYQTFGTKLDGFDGKKISTLYKIKNQAPEFFYNTLKGHVGSSSLPELLDLIDALDRLASKEA